MKKIITIAALLIMVMASSAFAEDIFFVYNQFKKALAVNNRQDVANNIREMSLVLSMEKTAKDVDDTEDNKKRSKMLRKQIIYIGNCERGLLSFEQNQDDLARLVNDFEIVHENKSVCAEFKEESPSMLSINTEKSKNDLLEFCNICADRSSFFLGYAASVQGNTKKTVKYLSEYINGEDKKYLTSAYEHRLPASIRENYYDYAMTDARRMTIAEPKNQNYWVALGFVKIKWYDISKEPRYLDDAKRNLDEALALDPKNKDANELMKAIKIIRERDNL